jgi:hypothetical protein
VHVIGGEGEDVPERQEQAQTATMAIPVGLPAFSTAPYLGEII